MRNTLTIIDVMSPVPETHGVTPMAGENPAPTPAEIAERAAEIRQRWTDAERRRREGLIVSVELNVIRVNDLAPPG